MMVSDIVNKTKNLKNGLDFIEISLIIGMILVVIFFVAVSLKGG